MATSEPVHGKQRVAEDSQHLAGLGVDALLSVSQMIAGTLERDAVITSAMDAVSEAMAAEACSILLRDPDTNELCFHIVKGEQTDGLDHTRVPVDDTSIAG